MEMMIRRRSREDLRTRCIEYTRFAFKIRLKSFFAVVQWIFHAISFVNTENSPCSLKLLIRLNFFLTQRQFSRIMRIRLRENLPCRYSFTKYSTVWKFLFSMSHRNPHLRSFVVENLDLIIETSVLKILITI